MALTTGQALQAVLEAAGYRSSSVDEYFLQVSAYMHGPIPTVCCFVTRTER